jgi:antitoxin MazE
MSSSLPWTPCENRRILIVDTVAASTQIARWGNSLGLRLPKSVAAEAQLAEGDTVEISVTGGAVVIRPARPTYSLHELVGRITPRNRHRETDWGAPAGDEHW